VLSELSAGWVATLVTGELGLEECSEDPDDLDDGTLTGDPSEDPVVLVSTRPVIPVSSTMARAATSQWRAGPGPDIRSCRVVDGDRAATAGGWPGWVDVPALKLSRRRPAVNATSAALDGRQAGSLAVRCITKALTSGGTEGGSGGSGRIP
jgi:hypothetical protein